jgi:hypothetical protein
MDPARIFTESLTPRPELENSQGHTRPFSDVASMSELQSGRRADIGGRLKCAMCGLPTALFECTYTL